MNRKKLSLLKRQIKENNKDISAENFDIIVRREIKDHEVKKKKVIKKSPVTERLEFIHIAYNDKRFFLTAPSVKGIRSSKGFRVFRQIGGKFVCEEFWSLREVRVEGIKYIVPHHIFRTNPNYKIELLQYEREQSRVQGSGPRQKPKPSTCSKHPDWRKFRSETSYFPRGKVPLGKGTVRDGVCVFKEYIPNPYPDKPHEGRDEEGEGEDAGDDDECDGEDDHDSWQEEEDGASSVYSRDSGMWSDDDDASRDSRGRVKYYQPAFGDECDEYDPGPTGRPLYLVGVG